MEKILAKFSQTPQPAVSDYIENLKADHLLLISYTRDRQSLINCNYITRLHKIFLFAFKKKYYGISNWRNLIRDLLSNNN